MSQQSSTPEWLADPMVPWRVSILPAGNGEAVVDIVFATSAKQALSATIANMSENHPAWQWPGWRDIQIHPMRGAFIVGAITGGRT